MILRKPTNKTNSNSLSAKKKNSFSIALPTIPQNDFEKSKSRTNYLPPTTGADQSGYTDLMRKDLTEAHEDFEGNWLLSYSDLMTLLFGFFVMLMSFSKIDVETYERARKITTQYFGGEYKMPLQKLNTDLNQQINQNAKQVNDQVHIDMDVKGVTVTFRGSLFFDAGSSELKKQAEELVHQIIPSIKNQGSDMMVIIEGHTDDNPIKEPRFPSNWELSSYRASSILRIFEQAGFPSQNLRAIGFGSTMPALPNRDKNGKPIPENQSQNRRVVIRIVSKQK